MVEVATVDGTFGCLRWLVGVVIRWDILLKRTSLPSRRIGGYADMALCRAFLA